MLKPFLIYFCELLGLGSLLLIIKFIPFSKSVMGVVLSLTGAFFPELNKGKKERGEGTIDAGKIKVILKGGVRFAVVMGGLVLIVGAVLEGYGDYQKKKSQEISAGFLGMSSAAFKNRFLLADSLGTQIVPNHSAGPVNSQDSIMAVVIQKMVQEQMEKEKQKQVLNGK
jgi:uridylate kinase